MKTENNTHAPEPWRFIEHLTWPGYGHVEPIMTDEMGLIEKSIGERMAEDHNALSGIKDPADTLRKVKEALDMISNGPTCGLLTRDGIIQIAKDALRLLSPVSE